MSDKKSRADYMSSAQKNKLKAGQTRKDGSPLVPRTHQNCIDLVGVARPGKTAKDRASSLASRV